MTARIVEWEHGTLSLGLSVVALGVFDGVHIGHQALITDAVKRANALGALSCVMTFDRDPDQVLTPDRVAPQLLTLEDKLAVIANLDVEAIVVVPFCRLVAEMAPDRFVSDTLADAVRPVEVLVGHDFRFGRFASGNVSQLERSGREHGFSVIAHDLVCRGGSPVTSTRIRTLVTSGDVVAAAELLGRPHRVHGTVGRGRAEGRKLGAPTANVTPVAYSAIPGDGVYAGSAILGDRRFVAAISVGTPPTFPYAHDYLEAHLLDFEDDIYGEQMVLEFVERLREHRVYDTRAELASAVQEDIRHVTSVMAASRNG